MKITSACMLSSLVVMAADKQGDVYTLDTHSGIIHKSSDGGVSWNLIADAPGSCSSLAIDADGAGWAWG